MLLEELGLPHPEKLDRRPPKFKDYLLQREEEEEDSLSNTKKIYGVMPPPWKHNTIPYLLNMLNREELPIYSENNLEVNLKITLK